MDSFERCLKPCDVCVLGGHADVVSILVDAGADIDLREGDCDTPFVFFFVFFIAVFRSYCFAIGNTCDAECNALITDLGVV